MLHPLPRWKSSMTMHVTCAHVTLQACRDALFFRPCRSRADGRCGHTCRLCAVCAYVCHTIQVHERWHMCRACVVYALCVRCSRQDQVVRRDKWDTSPSPSHAPRVRPFQTCSHSFVCRCVAAHVSTRFCGGRRRVATGAIHHLKTAPLSWFGIASFSYKAASHPREP